MRVLVVGAGFAGAVCAERLASAGHNVLVIDRRDHIGGNAFDYFDDAGVLVHRYGPHIFHTNSRRIFDYLSRFTAWRPYEHRVRASVSGVLYPIPINRTTINSLYQLSLDEAGVASYLDRVRLPITTPVSSEDVVLSAVGRDLCEIFFRGYTKKQWGLDLHQLGPSVAKRIPVRTNDDDRYFTDRYQFMPREGYTHLFRNLLDHPRIRVDLSTPYSGGNKSFNFDHLIFTGPIDEYFGFANGRLQYRSLVFEHEHIPDKLTFQPIGTVNYPNDFAFTRITEFKHLTGQQHEGTSIVREFPSEHGDPYYPVPTVENDDRYREYFRAAHSLSNVTFVGRLARYQYLNMDQVVGAALKAVSVLDVDSSDPFPDEE